MPLGGLRVWTTEDEDRPRISRPVSSTSSFHILGDHYKVLQEKRFNPTSTISLIEFIMTNQDQLSAKSYFTDVVDVFNEKSFILFKNFL